MAGKYEVASPELSLPSCMKCSRAAESWVICSSKSENSTTAAAPLSSRLRMASRCSEIGEADATSGFLSVRPM